MKRTLPFCMSVMLIAVGTWAAVPSLVNIQGRLADPTGVNKPDGTYKLKFTLFDQAAGGNQLWTETQTSVPVKNGVFQAFLGQVTALGTTFNGAGDVYLEIQVENDPAMVPRQRIVSAPLALRAARADALGNDNDVVTVTSDDKVGIGTTSPAERLHVSAPDTSPTVLKLQNSEGTAAVVNDNGVLQFGSDNSTNPGIRMTINSDKVGIGTTNPSATLSIASKDTTVRPALSIRADNNPAYGFDFDHDQADVGRLDLYAVVNGARTRSMTISRQSGKVGHVGIGTTSPDAMLAVSNGDSSGWGATIEKTAGSGTPEGLLVVTSQNGSNKILGLAQGSVGSPNYKVIVQADGKVGVGTTSPDGVMDVRGSDTVLDLVRTGGSGRIFGVYADSPKDSNSVALYVDRNRRVGIRTDNPGNYGLYVVGDAWSTGDWQGSDIRFKRNVTPLASIGIMTKLRNINGITYQLKKEFFPDDELAIPIRVGLSAQELEKQFPELVRTNEDGYKAIAYDRFTVVLLQAIKEQQAEIDLLRKEIDSLKASK